MTFLTRLIRKPLFAGSFFLFLFLFFLLSAGSLEGFTLFKAWTINQNLKIGSTFVRADEYTTSAVGTVLAQVKVGNGAFYVLNQQSGGVDLYSKTEALVYTDILEVLSTSSDPEKVLELHLAQMEQALQEIDSTYASYADLSAERQAASDECLAKKRAGDAQFFEGVENGDRSEFTLGLETSVAEAPCYITNRIEANAYAYLAQRSLAFQRILTERLQILSNNKALLLQSYPLLQGDIAEQLVAFKRTLAGINTQSQATAQGLFSLPGNAEVSQYPNLQNIWFRDNDINVPTFLDPSSPLSSQDKEN